MIWIPAEFANEHWIYNCFCLPYMNFSFLWNFSFLALNPSVSISHEEWCWKHKSVELDVLDADVLGVEFRQIGYILRCSLSHAITLVSNLFIQARVSANLSLLFKCFFFLFPPTGILPRWQQTWKRGRVQPHQGSQPLLPLQTWWVSWPLIS